MKRKLTVLSTRLARYRKSRARRIDNKKFDNSKRSFYRDLGKQGDDTSNQQYPTKEAVTAFCKQQLETPAFYNREALWIGMEQKQYQTNLVCEYDMLTAEDMTNVMKAANWKGPGLEKLHNYWLKKFRCMHQRLAELTS